LSFVRQSASINDVGPHRSVALKRDKLSFAIAKSMAHLLSTTPDGLPILQM